MEQIVGMQNMFATRYILNSVATCFSCVAVNVIHLVKVEMRLFEKDSVD